MIHVTAEELATIQAILAEHGAGFEVRVFGSRITDRRKPYSDLDLAIVGDGALPGGRIDALREAFQESDLTFRVDVLDYWAVSDEFREVIDGRFERLPFKGQRI